MQGPAVPRADRHLRDTRDATTGRKVGRPRAVVPADAAERFRELAADGWSLIGIAERLGTNRATLSQWLDNDPALKEAFEFGRAHEEHALHSMLFRLAVEKDDKLAALAILNSRFGWRQDDKGEGVNRVQITFALPGAMKPEQFVVEQTNDRNPENLALPRAGAVRS